MYVRLDCTNKLFFLMVLIKKMTYSSSQYSKVQSTSKDIKKILNVRY